MNRAMPEVTTVYRASLLRVVDGDTMHMRLNRGMGDYSDRDLRLLGLNCPEIHGPSKDTGYAARDFTVRFFAEGALENPSGEPFRVQVAKPDSFGRLLSYVWRESDGASLNSMLLESGNAVPMSELMQLKEAP